MGIVRSFTSRANHSGGGVLELLQQIVNEPPPQLPEGKDYQGLDKLIGRCLVKDPDKRPRPEELMVPFALPHANCRKIRLLLRRPKRKLIWQHGLRRFFLQIEGGWRDASIGNYLSQHRSF